LSSDITVKELKKQMQTLEELCYKILRILSDRIDWQPNIDRIFLLPKNVFERLYPKLYPKHFAKTKIIPLAFIHPQPDIVKEICGNSEYKKWSFLVYIKMEKDHNIPSLRDTIAFAFIHELLHIYYPSKTEQKVYNFGYAVFEGIRARYWRELDLE